VIALVRGRLDRIDQARKPDSLKRGAGMGDKGGKKDKEKQKQQQVTKQKPREQKKHDNAPAKKVSGTP
jgi:hypothetical protein